MRYYDILQLSSQVQQPETLALFLPSIHPPHHSKMTLFLEIAYSNSDIRWVPLNANLEFLLFFKKHLRESPTFYIQGYLRESPTFTLKNKSQRCQIVEEGLLNVKG